jgi:hypothetical protein
MEITNISYEEFVIGVSKGTIQFEILDKTGYVNLYYKTFAAVILTILLAFIYGPIILIPVLSYVFNKMILLTGIPGFIFGYFLFRESLKRNYPFNNLGSATLLFIITAAIFIYFPDIMTPLTVIFTCTIYQFYFLNLNEYFYKESARNRLINNRSNYNFVTKYNIIKTFHVQEKQDAY